MAQRRMGTSPEGFTHGSEDRLGELTVASQIRAREAEIAREYAAESMSPTPSTRESTNPDIITPSGARNARGQLFTTEARKSPSAPIAAKPQQGRAANINDMFTWDHGQLMEHFMAREAGDTVMLNCQNFQLDGPALRVYISDSTGQPRADIINLLRELTGDDTPKWFIPRITADIELALEWYCVNPSGDVPMRRCAIAVR